MLEGLHYQNAYVTRNLEKAAARITGRFKPAARQSNSRLRLLSPWII
jgi:uncharacterized membrane protein YoaK (UPF0700 family)